MTPRRIMRVMAAGAVCALFATGFVTACTTEASSNPGPTLTTTSSTSTSTTSTSTTIAPTTTKPAESTTTASTSTLPDGPVDALVPLLVGGGDSGGGGGGGGGWLFLGAWQQDRWQEATDPSGNPIRPGIEAGAPFTVSNLDGETAAVIGENVEACQDGRVGPTVDVEIPAPEPPGYGYSAVAVLTNAWALKPRPVAVLSTAPDAYRALGVAAFAEGTVDASPGAVEQLVVTDLDGDGDDEALVSFEFVQPSVGPGAPGDLATVLLIDTTTRAARTVLLSAIDPGASADSIPEPIQRFRVLDVADLNGDGRMEVLVHSWYYEGASVLVFTYDGEQLTQVLTAGCGS